MRVPFAGQCLKKREAFRLAFESHLAQKAVTAMLDEHATHI